MRLFFGLLLSAVLFGCQGNDQGRPQNLQGRVDSLQRANQELARQVEVLHDSLRALEEGAMLSPPVYFPSGSAWIPDRGRRQLDKHAQTLKDEYPDADFRIKGYTDPVPIGSTLKDTYPSNWYLAAQRAAAVAHYLDKEHGVRSKSLKIEAFGPQQVRPNETPERRPKKRRVEIVVEDGS